jgi:YesN/AraC family two-component response regulator
MKKILVIEDEAPARNLFVKLLQAVGYYTIGAENGLIGVQKAQEYFPDLIVCDIVMPQMDGYGVLKELRQNRALAVIPFIFLTARVYKADIRKGMELGADDYLTKPCTIEELMRAIAAQLEKQEVHRQWYAARCQPSPETLYADTAKAAEPQFIFPPIPHLREVFDFIETNYQKSITLHDVSQAVGYSRAYLTNLVANQTGQTVNRWIVQRRMAEARSLLRDTNQSVEQIAVAVGYQTICNFFRQFRQIHGQTPHAWRKAQQNQSVININKTIDSST